MSVLDFSFARRTPLLLQTEAAECGLACLAMVAGFHGHRIDMATLRARHSISLKGSSLTDLMRLAGALELTPRPLRLELEHLPQLKLPCVLHWDMNHFVVLVALRGGDAVLHDPAQGERVMPLAELSKHFTGVALELRPTHAFTPRTERRRVPLRALLPTLGGHRLLIVQVIGLALALQVFALVAPFFMQWVVDHAIVARDHDLVAVLGVGFLLLALVQTGTTALRGWLLTVFGTTLTLEMMSNLFRHLVRLPMA